MDGVHFPEIVDLREPSGIALKGTRRNGASQERRSNFSRHLNKTGKRRLQNSEKTSRKRTSQDNTLQKTSSIRMSLNSGKSKSFKASKQFDAIGLPKISPTRVNEDEKSKGRAKKWKSSKQAEGETISYIYSKSLLDENTMAFLRNIVDVDRDGNHLVSKDVNKSNLTGHKKPYGLPALKIPEEIQQVEKDFPLTDSETESLLNAWETIDDEWSNGTTSQSANNSISSEGHA